MRRGQADRESNGWNHRAADQEYQVRNMNTALSTNWDFHVSCGPNMHALSPPSHAQSQSNSWESRQKVGGAWTMLKFSQSSTRGSGSDFGMLLTSPGCQIDVRFLTCRLTVPSSEYTTTRRPGRSSVWAGGDQHDYTHSAHNHSHWWCARSINPISQSRAQSASNQYNPPVCQRSLFLRISPLLICVYSITQSTPTFVHTAGHHAPI